MKFPENIAGNWSYTPLLRATQNNGGTKDEYRCVGKEYSEVS